VSCSAPPRSGAGDYLPCDLGFREIIEIVANNLNGVTGGRPGTPVYTHFPSISFRQVRWTGTVLLLLLILIVAVKFNVAYQFSRKHSGVGRSWTAIREDEVRGPIPSHHT